MITRAEQEADYPAVKAVLEAAFEQAAEASLVTALRSRATPIVSLVADDEGVISGHILFTPVTLEGDSGLIMGLAPMAVIPGQQRSGIGSLLIQAGLEECKRIGAVAVVVLGHPEYYPKFGFVPASRFEIKSEYEVPDEVFMAMELRDGALSGRSGTVKYHAAFGEL